MHGLFRRHKLPIVLQSEHAECVLACLAMVASYHGRQTTLTQLRQQYSISQRGAGLADLMALAEQLGLSARAVKVELDEIRYLKAPAILHWDLNHFVVLKAANRSRFDIHDPAIGSRRYSPSDLSVHFTGIALELSPRVNFEQTRPPPRLKLGALLHSTQGLNLSIIQIIALSLFIQLFTLAFPFYLQFVVDEVLVKQDYALLSTLAIGFAGLTAITIVARTLRSLCTIFIANALSIQINSGLFTHLIRLPMQYFHKRHIGDVISRFESLKPIQAFFTSGAVTVTVDGLMASTTALAMFVYAPGLTALVLTFFAIYAGLRLITFTLLRNRELESLGQHAGLDAHFIETVRSLQSIKVAGPEENRASLWQNKLVAACNTDVRIARLQISLETLRAALSGFETVIVVFIGATNVLNGAFTIGMLYAFMAYKNHFSNAVGNLVDELIRFRMLGLYLERVADIALTPVEACFDYTNSHPTNDTGNHTNHYTSNYTSKYTGDLCSALQAADTTATPGGIELDNLCFRYAPNDPLILNALSLRIEENRMLAISGASGCGKSTLLKIILGLLEPTDGRLLVGGKPITQDMVRTHRARIGAVLSEDRLLSGSINANVSLFDPQPDLEQIQTCCRVAEIHDDIVATPMGYHSVVGDMGAALSAGQQQRLLLARALYRRPALLLLDESTSHIDTVTAIKIFANLRNSQLTCVFVTHNESLLPLADDVFYLDGEASDCGISAGEFPAHTPGEGESLPPRATHPDD